MSQSDMRVIDPENTLFYVASGVQVNGTIEWRGDEAQRAVITGVVRGTIDWDGVVQVPNGGLIEATGELRCRELVVNGDIRAAEGCDVTIVAGVLHAGPNAQIDVGVIHVPSGGLSQERGAIFNARLQMTAQHPFATQPTASGGIPTLVAVTGGQPRGHEGHSGEATGTDQ